ncbi:MAG: 30S ribosomal protein S9 [Spirochaetota bacterium]|nr:MAG: 30S ribosomal protein S9 [Spirochaetota bacterium]
MPDNWIFATGRRKTSIARVMVRKGNGNVLINNKNPEDYFPTKNQVVLINQPIESSSNNGKWDFKITVRGGGFNGQAGAIRHGIARALLEADPDSKQALSKAGFLTRDARMVERKKAGRPKARKRFQFSKR